ncbi:MAG: DNA polymerase III subunit [Anaerolineae bacterium]|nr:DNA polymerase III subunit [Anaerolineae bacterium]
MTQNDKQNWPVWGHDWAVDFLQRSVANKRNRHAYLITGSRQVGKMQLALTFAMVLNCTHDDERLRPCMQCRSCKLIDSGNHPDMLFSQTDEKSGALKIDAIRDVMRLIALKPFSSRYRVAIFDDFDAAQNRAQDALLKTLEEPPSHAVLIVLAESSENIMPTITSRCQLIPLRHVSQSAVQQYLEMHGADEERATLLARLSNGRIGWALTALRDETVMAERDDILNKLRDVIRGNRVRRFEIAHELEKIGRKDKTDLRYLLEMWQTYWRDVLLLAQGNPVKPCNSDRLKEIEQLVQRIQVDDALKALQATRSMLMETLKTNANMRMAFEILFLDYPGLSR